MTKHTARPDPFAYTFYEGGHWRPARLEKTTEPVWAILFEDGSIFDTYTGWRKTYYDKKRMDEIYDLWKAEGVV